MATDESTVWKRAALGAEQPKVVQLIDRSKLPTREREIKEYRFRNRLHQAASQARARLRSQARAKSAGDQSDAKA